MNYTSPLAHCRWIGPSEDCSSPLLIRRFCAPTPLRAELTITGLGYFIPRINGMDVTGDLFQPVCSEYGPRDLGKFQYPLRDQLRYRIYYCTYDVTQLISQGENMLTIHLGNGWYRQKERIAEGPMSYGDRLKAIYNLKLTYANREIELRSDGTETWCPSHILYNNLFTGEIHDYGAPEAPEKAVTLLPEAQATLCPQIGPPDRVIRNLAPKLLHEIGSRRIYDAGANLSGLVDLLLCGNAGEQVTVRYAENLTEDGELDFESTGSGYKCASGIFQIQQDRCTCGAEKRRFRPQFCWHAFRYFEVEGPGEDPVVEVIHSDVAVTAEFDSDCEGLNYLFETFLRTQLNNMHGSIPSDCPHRERLGYTGDGQVTAAATMMLLDTREFYRKWMRDILDCQDTVTGHTQHTVPLGGGGGGPVGWGGAIVVVPYRFFKQYGDVSLLEESWGGIQKWLEYIRSRMDDGLVTREEPKGWCLGDWATPEKIAIPAPYVNTCLMIRCLDMLRECAPLLGKQADIPVFDELRNQCAEAVLSAYFDRTTGSFCDGIQGADAFALCVDLGDERTGRNLVERYRRLGHFDTGFIGTDLLMEALFRHGAADVALELLSGDGPGSFLYMKRRGATTLWEHWDGSESQDHPMFGGCVRQLFEGFLGIRQPYGTGGYSQVYLTPVLPEGLGRIRGNLLTPAGWLEVNLCRENGVIRQQVRLPNQPQRSNNDV